MRAARPRISRMAASHQLLQLFGIELRSARRRGAIFIRDHIGVGPLGDLLQIRRQLDVGEFLLPQKILHRHAHHRLLMEKHPAIKSFDPRLVHEQDDDQQVHDNREPRGLAFARAREVVLQMEKQLGNRVFVEVPIGGFPVLRVVESRSLRRWNRRRQWISRWCLRGRHLQAFCLKLQPGFAHGRQKSGRVGRRVTLILAFFTANR